MYLQDILHMIIEHIYIAEDERALLHDSANHILVTATMDEHGRPGLRFIDDRDDITITERPEGA